VGVHWSSNALKVSPPLPPLYMDLAAAAQVSSSMLMEGMVGIMFLPNKVASTFHIVVDFGVLTPIVLVMRFHSVLK
jgi:hypothetical protein